MRGVDGSGSARSGLAWFSAQCGRCLLKWASCSDFVQVRGVDDEHVILDLTSEDESGEWAEDAEESLSAIVGVRSELAAGDLRPLYLAWLSG